MEFFNIFNKKMPEREEGKVYKIALPKGTGPSYSVLNTYQRIAFRIFGKIASRNKNISKMGDDLLKAHMMIRPQEYIAYVYFLTLISFVGILAIFIFLLLLGNIFLTLMGLIALILVPSIIYIIMMGNPASVAKTRGKKIDGKLPATMNFISALASADVNVDMIFKELARRPEYKEVAKEAEWITRDTELLGKDILTALRDAAKRSPSQKWSEFLQGVVTTSTSGGRLKPYFIAKGEEYENELRLQMKRTMETLSLFAESFVTVGVAFPLFLIIIVAIMALISPTPGMSMMLLYFVVFIMLPVLVILFAWIIKSTSEVVS
ncbi:MAG: type II secretion system F family protein [Thermoplasmata archaeon]|nr:type II secretion protein F [Euryarchaeota archaeon]MVT35286.1 type II secretion protein F [Euryarchaeota archaeon]